MNKYRVLWWPCDNLKIRKGYVIAEAVVDADSNDSARAKAKSMLRRQTEIDFSDCEIDVLELRLQDGWLI